MAGRAFTIPTIFTALNRFTAPVRAMQASMRGFGATTEIALARAERGFRALMAPLSAVGKMLRYFGYFFGGAALVLGIGGIIKTVADFQQANADLNAVMNDAAPGLLKKLSDDAKKLGMSTARTATQVTGLQIELAKLGYQGPEILNMTKSLISGSIAMDGELDRVATLGGAMVRTFTKLSSTDMPMIMDQMTLATLDTALSFEKLETMLPIVSGAANAVGITFSRQLALLGKLSDAGIDASSSATALRNIFIDSRRRGHSYEQVLANIQKHADRLTPAFNKFGKRGAVSAVVLADKLKEVVMEEQRLIDSMGVADRVAAKRLDTFKGSLLLVKSAWQGLVLSIEDGTGKYAKATKAILDTVRGVLLLTIGTKEAMDAFSKMSPEFQASSKVTLDWLGIIWKIIKALIAFKILLIATRIALTAYSLWVGIAAAAMGVLGPAIGGGVIGLTAYNVVLALAKAGTKAFVVGLNVLKVATGPVGLAILGLIAIIESFNRNWDYVFGAKKNDTFLDFLGRIAATINDGILYPIQMLFELLSHLPGALGNGFSVFAKKIEELRGVVGTAQTAEQPKAVNDRYKNLSARSREIAEKYDLLEYSAKDDALAKFQRDKFEGAMSVQFNGPPGFSAKSESSSVKIGPRIGSTMGYGPTGN